MFPLADDAGCTPTASSGATCAEPDACRVYKLYVFCMTGCNILLSHLTTMHVTMVTPWTGLMKEGLQKLTSPARPQLAQSRLLLVQRHKELVQQVLPPHEPLLQQLLPLHEPLLQQLLPPHEPVLPQELLPWEEMRWLPLLAQLAGWA